MQLLGLPVDQLKVVAVPALTGTPIGICRSRCPPSPSAAGAPVGPGLEAADA